MLSSAPQPLALPVSGKKTLLFCKPLPCNPAAETTIQPLIWSSPRGLLLLGNVFFTDTGKSTPAFLHGCAGLPPDSGPRRPGSPVQGGRREDDAARSFRRMQVAIIIIIIINSYYY